MPNFIFFIILVGGGVFPLIWQHPLRLLFSFLSPPDNSFTAILLLIYRPLRRRSLFFIFFYTSHHFFTALIPPLMGGCKRWGKKMGTMTGVREGEKDGDERERRKTIPKSPAVHVRHTWIPAGGVERRYTSDITANCPLSNGQPANHVTAALPLSLLLWPTVIRGATQMRAGPPTLPRSNLPRSSALERCRTPLMSSFSSLSPFRNIKNAF